MALTRRDFLAGTSVVGAGLLAERSSLAQLIAGIVGESGEFAAPGEFKVKYFGQFSELPVGAVKARGWIAGWLGRQLEGLTGHPENLGYPYNTCMLGGKIPPPQVKHGDSWWPYEQSGYFFDGSLRLGLLSDDAAAKKIPDGILRYVLANSGPGKIGESRWGWPCVVSGRALMAEYTGTGNPASVQVLKNYVLGSHLYGGRDGFIAEEAFYLYGLTGDARLRALGEENYRRYFLSDPLSFSYQDRLSGKAPLHEHGVTAAEQLKLLPLMFS